MLAQALRKLTHQDHACLCPWYADTIVVPPAGCERMRQLDTACVMCTISSVKNEGLDVRVRPANVNS